MISTSGQKKLRSNFLGQLFEDLATLSPAELKPPLKPVADDELEVGILECPESQRIWILIMRLTKELQEPMARETPLSEDEQVIVFRKIYRRYALIQILQSAIMDYIQPTAVLAEAQSSAHCGFALREGWAIVLKPIGKQNLTVIVNIDKEFLKAGPGNYEVQTDIAKLVVTQCYKLMLDDLRQ